VAAPVLSPAAGARGSPGAALSREQEPEPRGHMAASELPLAGSRCLDLKLIREGTRSSGYQQWPPGPPRERLRTYGWGQHPFPAQPF
jgi:hypothetical protein